MFWTKLFSSFHSTRNTLHSLYLPFLLQIYKQMSMFSCACFALTVWALTHHWYFSFTISQLTCDFTGLITLPWWQLVGFTEPLKWSGRPIHRGCCGGTEECTDSLLGALSWSNRLRNTWGVFLSVSWWIWIELKGSAHLPLNFQVFEMWFVFPSNKQRSRWSLGWDPASEDFLTKIF